ncbi:hypothetical protein HAX54_000339 [Datura stramonium]|uniref:Uncharacterized protein n=1 Tax=Datura stramonium TaxID=4076 RepID=A0ABS8T347_DATST|nr:hypothetical protein [Datura stramonium]
MSLGGNPVAEWEMRDFQHIQGSAMYKLCCKGLLGSAAGRIPAIDLTILRRRSWALPMHQQQSMCAELDTVTYRPKRVVDKWQLSSSEFERKPNKRNFLTRSR